MPDDTHIDLSERAAALEQMLVERTSEREEALAEVLDAVNHSSGDTQQHGGSGGGMTASARLRRRPAPRNDMAGVVIASEAKQSRSGAAGREA